MKLFHGTIHEFTVPDPSRGRTGTDFGAGFYLTDSERMTDDWLNGEENKHVNIYELTLSKISSCSLHIRRYETASIEWAKFVTTTAVQRSQAIGMISLSVPWPTIR